jgi:hypothetical protein
MIGIRDLKLIAILFKQLRQPTEVRLINGNYLDMR